MATVYVDGDFYPGDEAQISVYDHGLLYGDGIFEGIPVYQGKPFKLEAHLKRLKEGAGALMLSLPLSLEEIGQKILETVGREKLERGYVRLLLTRGKGDLGLDPAKCKSPTLIIIADTIKLYPDEYYKKGIPIVTASTRRIGAGQWDPRIKSLNYLNNILAKMEARQAGCLEAVMLNGEDYVCECTADNLFLVKDEKIFTPASHCGLLEGITRNTLMEWSAEIGRPVEEAMLRRFDLYKADEIFMTGSGAELLPVISVDGRITGSGKPGPVFRELLALFRAKIL